MERTEKQRSATASRLRWLLVVGLLAYNVVVFVMGSLAAAIGGGLSDWGKGAGGLGGSSLDTYFGLAVGLAAGLATFRENRSVPASVGVFFTGLLIGTGYLVGGHLVDPCDRGWLDVAAKIGDARLCSGYGDIAVRFHLLLHATLGVVSATVATIIYRRKHLFEWWPPSPRPDSVVPL